MSFFLVPTTKDKIRLKLEHFYRRFLLRVRPSADDAAHYARSFALYGISTTSKLFAHAGPPPPLIFFPLPPSPPSWPSSLGLLLPGMNCLAPAFSPALVGLPLPTCCPCDRLVSRACEPPRPADPLPLETGLPRIEPPLATGRPDCCKPLSTPGPVPALGWWFVAA